jgi:ABC-type transport system involved in multi-copper enzyme maturation permease subunit
MPSETDRIDSQNVRSDPSATQKLLRGVLGVLRYESSRSLTPVRIAAWISLALFPVGIILAVRMLTSRIEVRDMEDVWYVLLALVFVLQIEIVTVLSMLLWATPVVHAELEGQTWVYSVVRPHARWMVLWGKYLASFLWTSSCTVMSVSLIAPWLDTPNPVRTWLICVSLCILSAMAHGALFIAIGTFFQKRAMVVAFAFAAVVEGVLAWIPALINRFTISYRLRSILVNSLLSDEELPRPLDEILVSPDASSVHLAILVLFTVTLLLAASIRIYRTQFSWQSEY